MSSLAEATQQDLFDAPPPAAAGRLVADEGPDEWFPGADAVHDRHGRGWVERIEPDALTVRFETPDGPPGVARRLPPGDPALHPAPPPER